MSKLVIFKFGLGSLQNGFDNVIAELHVDDKSPALTLRGSLPAQPEFPTQYLSCLGAEANFSELSNILKNQINHFLDAEGFKGIIDGLNNNLHINDEIRIIIDTENEDLELLPWHLWKFFEIYPQAEWALASLGVNSGEVNAASQTPVGKVKILIIICDDSGLDERDTKYVEGLEKKGAEIFVKQQLSHQELSDLLEKEKWDIIFFDDCRNTDDRDENGIYISQSAKITLDEFALSIKTAVRNGLQIGIFNSCRGLKLSKDLAKSHLSHMIVMREKLSSKTAQNFVRNFLINLVENQSLYLCIRAERRKSLHASWLPVIYQNPTVVSPTWNQLQRLGTLKNKRYQLIRQLGEGGFGKAYLAEDTENPHENKQCTIKQLEPAIADAEIAKKMFIREGKILQQLDHPQIPKFIDYFEGEDAELYIVEEYINGNSLKQEITTQTKFTPEKVINFLNDVLPILEYLHGQNVIHRDIKPGNLIKRKEDNKFVLIDFGAIKQIVDPESNSQSKTNLTISIGSDDYAAPEQLQRKPQLNSDIYALGMTAIQLLTGNHPSKFERDAKDNVLSPQAYGSLAAILNKMVRVKVTERYQNVDEIITDIKKIIMLAEDPTITRPEPIFGSGINKVKSRRIILTLLTVGTIFLGITEFVYPFIRPLYYLHQGNALLDAYKPEEALESFEEILEIQPNTNNAEVWNGRGDALYGSGRYDAAFASYQKANALDPNNPKILSNLGRIAYKLNAYADIKDKDNKSMQQALIYYQQALKVAQDDRDKSEAWSGQGIILMSLGECQAALRAFENARTETPDKPNVWIQEASVLQFCLHQPDKAKRIYEEALDIYDRELKQNPNNLISWVDRGEVLNQLKRSPEDELDSYEQALKRNRNFYPALITKGTVLTNLKRYKEALASFDQALTIHPKDYQTLYNRGFLLSQQLNDPDQALVSFQEALKISPFFYPAWSGRVEILIFVKKNYTEALSILDEKKEVYGDNPFYWYYRASCLQGLKQSKEALESYDKALAINAKAQAFPPDQIASIMKDRQQLQQELQR
jgi:tetratricopeptide (TPR) repeat protein/tRNA A-37 threonylcarbamoyl transferase component Bud32